MFFFQYFTALNLYQNNVSHNVLRSVFYDPRFLDGNSNQNLSDQEKSSNYQA